MNKHPNHRHIVADGIRADAGGIYVLRFLEASANIDIWRDDEEYLCGYCLDAPDALPSGSSGGIFGKHIVRFTLRTWG